MPGRLFRYIKQISNDREGSRARGVVKAFPTPIVTNSAKRESEGEKNEEIEDSYKGNHGCDAGKSSGSEPAWLVGHG